MSSRKKVSERPADDWIGRVRESSHDVVLAGLASLTRSYRGGQKPQQADFKTLVAEGRNLEPELRDVARKVWSEWVEKPRSLVSQGAEGRLRGVFDERVQSVLVRLGVPTREEVADLQAKVDRLLAREGLAGDGQSAGGRKRKASRRAAAVRQTRPK